MEHKEAKWLRLAVAGLVAVIVFAVIAVLAFWSVQPVKQAMPQQEIGLIPPAVVISGADSKILEREYHRVVTLQDWAVLWQRHKGLEYSGEYDLFYDHAGLPLVDFERFMVLGIFQGKSVNSAGLQAISLAYQSGRIVFKFDDKAFQSGGPEADAAVPSPYGLFVIPKSDLPLVLEEDVRRLISGTPEWKECKTFPQL